MEILFNRFKVKGRKDDQRVPYTKPRQIHLPSAPKTQAHFTFPNSNAHPGGAPNPGWALNRKKYNGGSFGCGNGACCGWRGLEEGKGEKKGLGEIDNEGQDEEFEV